MNACEVCGNSYDKNFYVVVESVTHTFDCFECAIHALAPRCARCNVVIMGHGVESRGVFFCCANCARESGADGVVDRAA